MLIGFFFIRFSDYLQWWSGILCRRWYKLCMHSRHWCKMHSFWHSWLLLSRWQLSKWSKCVHTVFWMSKWVKMHSHIKIFKYLSLSNDGFLFNVLNVSTVCEAGKEYKAADGEFCECVPGAGTQCTYDQTPGCYCTSGTYANDQGVCVLKSDCICEWQRIKNESTEWQTLRTHIFILNSL